MAFTDYWRRDPVTAKPNESVSDAAKRMSRLGVGALAVVDDENHPIGMLTDRDIVQRVVRRRQDPSATAISEIMSPDIVSVWDEVPLVRAFHRMRQESVRRVLAVDSTGELVGILTYDDALPLIAEQLSLAADVVRAQWPASPTTT
jgi:CBS domain-containing protein